MGLTTSFQYNFMPGNFIFMAMYFVLSKGMSMPSIYRGIYSWLSKSRSLRQFVPCCVSAIRIRGYFSTFSQLLQSQHTTSEPWSWH